MACLRARLDMADGVELDELGARAVLDRLCAGDRQARRAVEARLDQIAELVDALTAAFRRGGSLALVGSGYAGRLGILQANECRLRFATEARRVRGYAEPEAGARDPWTGRSENAMAAGFRELERSGFSHADVLVAMDLPGPTTPFVIGAMQFARRCRAGIAAIASEPGSAALSLASRPIVLDLGPELMRGGDFKAGGALKLALDLILGAAMVGLGKVYRGRVVDLAPLPRPLAGRARDLVMKVAECDPASAEEALAASDRRPRLAILMVMLGLEREEAEPLLARSGGHLARALAAWRLEHAL